MSGPVLVVRRPGEAECGLVMSPSGLLVLSREHFPAHAGNDVSRTHARVDALAPDRLRLRDVSLGCGTWIRPSGQWQPVVYDEVNLPVDVRLGSKLVARLVRVEGLQPARVATPDPATVPLAVRRPSLQLHLVDAGLPGSLVLRTVAGSVALPLPEMLDVVMFEMLLWLNIDGEPGIVDLGPALPWVPLVDAWGYARVGSEYGGHGDEAGKLLRPGQYPAWLLDRPLARRHLVRGLRARVEHWGQALAAASRELEAAGGVVWPSTRAGLGIAGAGGGHHYYRLTSAWAITGVSRGWAAVSRFARR